jgi:hypothetical protein
MDADLNPGLPATTEASGGLSPREVRLCPGCGRPEAQWSEVGGEGVIGDDGATYCCRGCATETGCTCR